MAAGAGDADLISAIARGQLAPVYCLHGAERYLLDRCVAALKTAVIGATTGASFNSDAFDLKDSGLSTVLNAARTLPMFAKRRLVIGRGIDQLKADELELLPAYVADPNPSTCLVLLGEKVDGRLRAFAALRKAGFLHEFPRLRDKELASWIGREAATRKLPIDNDAAQALGETAGADLGRLSLALDQLGLFAGQGVRISRAHVEELITDSRERSVFDLTRAIGEGDRLAAMRLLANMLRNREPPLRIQFMLLRQFRQIWRAKELASTGVPRPEIASRIGMSPFFLDDVLVPARRMSVTTLDGSIRRLHQADRSLKSSRIDPEVQISKLVLQLADAAAAKPAAART